MPSLQVVDLADRNPPPENTSGFDQTFKAIREHQKQQKETDQLKKIYKEYQEQGQNIDRSLMQLQTEPGISPSRRVEASNQLIEMRKQNQTIRDKIESKYRKDESAKLREEAKVKKEEDKAKKAQSDQVAKDKKAKEERDQEQKSVYELYKEANYPDAEARRLSLIDSPTIANQKINRKVAANKPQKTTPSKESQYDKSRASAAGKQIVKDEENLAKAKDTLANLDQIEKIANEDLSGVAGYVKGALNTESAATVRNLAASSLDTYIKLFNPVGAVPVTKLNWIRDTFSISPYDNLSTIKGKVAVSKRLTQQAIDRAQERINLYDKYDGKPPANVKKKFDDDSANALEVLSDQEAFDLKMKEVGSEEAYVQGFYSVANGKKLKNIKKKDARKLFEQGLITNVPPG